MTCTPAEFGHWLRDYFCRAVSIFEPQHSISIEEYPAGTFREDQEVQHVARPLVAKVAKKAAAKPVAAKAAKPRKAVAKFISPQAHDAAAKELPAHFHGQVRETPR